MRPIHVALLDRQRPVLVLTREGVRGVWKNVTVAAITSTRRALSTEVAVGPANGLDHASAVNCDEVWTIPESELGLHIGYLHDDQEADLTRAIVAAFDLRRDR